MNATEGEDNHEYTFTSCPQDHGYDIRLEYIKEILCSHWAADNPIEPDKSTARKKFEDRCLYEWEQDIKQIYQGISKDWCKFLNSDKIGKLYRKYYKTKWQTA